MLADQAILLFKNTCTRVALALLWLLITVGFALADLTDDDDDDFDPLPGRTEEQIEKLIFDFDEVVETILLYASLTSILVILLVLALALRLKRWAAYVMLTFISMVWFMFFEQYWTGRYWIGLDFGYSTLVVMGFGLSCLHFLLAGGSIVPGKPFSRARPALLVCAALLWVPLYLAWPLQTDNVPIGFVAIALLACTSHVFAAPSFLTLSSPTVEVPRNGFVFVSILIFAGVAALLFGELDEELDLIFVARVVLLAAVGFFVVFFVRHALVLLRDRDANIRKSLADAQRDAAKTRELLEAEKKYTRAQEAARMHTMRLAAASHDIRQPITSLRNTMTAVAINQPEEVRSQLNAAFDYLDQLAKSYLDTGEAENAPTRTAGQADDGLESVSTAMICATLDRMFRKEAEAKGLKFDVQAQDATLRIQPLVVTRILCNLLSNAIKHTVAGEVNLIAETVKDGFRFSVFNSANMPDGPETETLFDPFVKGEASQGTGLGLSIVEDLVDAGGLRTYWTSPKGRGTTFSLLVPGEQIVALSGSQKNDRR